MTSKIPQEYQIEIIDFAEKEMRKGKSPTSLSKWGVDYLKGKNINVSARTILRLLEKRDRQVASAINTIVSTTYDIDLSKPRQMVDTIVSFLDIEVKKSFAKVELEGSSEQKQREIRGWLDILDRYIDKQIKISTLTSARKEDTKQESVSRGQIVVSEDTLDDSQEN